MPKQKSIWNIIQKHFFLSFYFRPWLSTLCFWHFHPLGFFSTCPPLSHLTPHSYISFISLHLAVNPDTTTVPTSIIYTIDHQSTTNDQYKTHQYLDFICPSHRFAIDKWGELPEKNRCVVYILKWCSTCTPSNF